MNKIAAGLIAFGTTALSLGLLSLISGKKSWRDGLPGGLADHKTPMDFPPDALNKGIQVELEHTGNPQIAMEIAMDHLMEDIDYYDKLATIEAHHDYMLGTGWWKGGYIGFK